MGYRQEIHGLDKVDQHPTVYRGLNELAEEIHSNSLRHGWWGTEGRNFGETLALIHSEVSEALEAWRDGHPINALLWEHKDGGICPGYSSCTEDDGHKPIGVPSELADIIIRVMDACAAHEIDIDEAIRVKMDYNLTRPIKHGRAV